MPIRFSFRQLAGKRRENGVDAVNDEAQNGRGDSTLAEATPELGLFLLNKDISSQAKYNVDVVAVHGLGGGPYKTWTDESGKLWLRDLLVEDLPGARIFTYGYDSAYVFSRETSTLRDYARALLEAIRSGRTATEVRN